MSVGKIGGSNANRTPPANNVGGNKSSRVQTKGLYWSSKDDTSKEIITSPAKKEVTAVFAYPNGNISSVVINICRGNDSPLVTKTVKVEHGKATLPCTFNDDGTYHFFIIISQKKHYSGDLKVGDSAPPSKSSVPAIGYGMFKDGFDQKKR